METAERTGALVAGVILTAIGAVFEGLVLTGVIHDGKISWLGWTFDWQTINWRLFSESTLGRSSWPIFLLVLGVVLVLVGLPRTGKTARGALVSIGTIPLLLGVFFLATTLGALRWEDQGYLWPTYPLIVGIAFLVWYVLSGSQVKAFLWAGVGLVALAAIFYGEALMSYNWWGQLWPLALIVAGALLLLPKMRRTPQ